MSGISSQSLTTVDFTAASADMGKPLKLSSQGPLPNDCLALRDIHESFSIAIARMKLLAQGLNGSLLIYQKPMLVALALLPS